VRIAASTICAAHELKVFHGSYPPAMWPPGYPTAPGAPGHEAAGEVVAVGPGVEGVACGQRVTMTGIGGDGTHAELVLREATAVVPVPLDTELATAALCEPAGCVLHAVDQAGPLRGRTAAVAGLGPTGLIAVQLARHAGAESVLGIDPVPARRELAQQLGADQTLDPLAPEAGAHLERAAEVVIECSGHARSVEQSFRTAARLLVIFGYTTEPLRVDQTVWFERELEIRNSAVLGHDPMGTFARAVALFVGGELNLAPLISHRLPLDRYTAALELVADHQALKVALVP